jgi:hypothetical protein
MNLIELAFSSLDSKGGRGSIDPAVLVGRYDPTKHPDVSTGLKTCDEILAEFLDTFDVGQCSNNASSSDGKVSLEEFGQYYTQISAGIESDDYFELMIRGSWGLTTATNTNGRGGGSSWSTQTPSGKMRVSCVLKDGSTRLIEIDDSFGLKPGDKREAMLRLRRQGVNLQSVSFLDDCLSINTKVRPAISGNLNWVSTFKLG